MQSSRIHRGSLLMCPSSSRTFAPSLVLLRNYQLPPSYMLRREARFQEKQSPCRENNVGDAKESRVPTGTDRGNVSIVPVHSLCSRGDDFFSLVSVIFFYLWFFLDFVKLSNLDRPLVTRLSEVLCLFSVSIDSQHTVPAFLNSVIT